MNNELVAKVMLETWERMGVKIQKWTDDNIVYVNVPKMAKTLPHEPVMTGEQLVKRMQQIADDMCGGRREITFKYKFID